MDRPASKSIQLDLTASYTAMLAFTFLLVGIGVWAALDHSIKETADRELHSRLADIRHYFNSFTPNDLQHLEEEFREESLLGQSSATIRIADADGKWLFQSTGMETWPAETLHAAELPHEGVCKTIRVRHQLIRVLTAPVRVGAIQLGLPIDEFEDVKNGFLWLLALGSPLLLLLAWLGGYFMSGRTLQPIDAAFQRMAQFTADASHELRTPVSIIQTTAELMQSRPRTYDEHLKAWKTITTETNRTGALIADLLTLARSDAGQSDFELVPIDLATIAKIAADELRVIAEAKGVALVCEARPTCPANGDFDALRRALCILLDNAIKFTPSGGQVSVAVRHSTVIVSDTGCGIDPKDLPMIFERFYRVSKDRSRKTGGTGLGLSIAKWITIQHGGDIRVESTVGKGSIFSLTLPDVTLP